MVDTSFAGVFYVEPAKVIDVTNVCSDVSDPSEAETEETEMLKEQINVP